MIRRPTFCTVMWPLLCAGLLALLAGCADAPPKDATYNLINAELVKAAAGEKARQAQSDTVGSALLPPLQIEMPRTGKLLEQKFDLVVNNAPAAQVFMGIVSGTRYSVMLHPEVTGTISANLKDVTVFEALDAIHEMYGYDYKVDGTRIFIQPLTMQTRVFLVNYIAGERKGTSSTRVISGSVSDAPTSTGGATGIPTIIGGATSHAQESSRITTSSTSDFWGELRATLVSIIGTKDGRNVVVSPQSGVVTVRALPMELSNVETFLKAAQLSVDRQVMLEAKILEVQLNDDFQSGINWASFASFNPLHNNRASIGQVTPGTTLTPLDANGNATALVGGVMTPITATPGSSIGAATNNVAGALFGLAFQTSNFAALLSFLESQGNVHVLSSPRIATMNNQKAVLKVGTDEFFVTNVSTTTTTGTTSTTTPSVTLQPFFSGIALDVTPQIDESGNIILHIHPSVSLVSTVNKVVDLGAGIGVLNLPLASSKISETDSIVRAQDGNVVAIGGLMSQSQTDNRSQVPGLGDLPGVGVLFRNTDKVTRKRELVILLKPTVIQNNDSWSQDILQSQQRIQVLKREPKAMNAERQ